MSTTLKTPISSIESNRRRVGALKSLGVVSVGYDALTYYPFRVTDPPARSLHEAKIGRKWRSPRMLETRVFPMARRGFRLIATVTDDDFAARRNTPKSLASLAFSYRKSYVDWVQRKLHAECCSSSQASQVRQSSAIHASRPAHHQSRAIAVGKRGMERRFRRSCESASRQSEIRCANDRRSAETSLPSTTGISCNFANFQRTYSRIGIEIYGCVARSRIFATQNAGNFLDNPTQEGILGYSPN